MPPKNTKKKQLKKLYSFPIFLLLIILTATTVRAAFSSYQRHVQEDKKVNGAIEDLSAMEKREDNLRKENEWLKTSRGQEELFRDQYMVAKEGENVMIITSNKDEDVDHTVTTETKENNILSKTKEMIGVGQ